MQGDSQSLCFPESGPYVVDTCLACSSASEQAWNVRYNCPSGQRGGKNKNKKKRGDITREFMLVLLQGVVSDYNKNREQRVNGCSNKLKNMVERDFVYNQTKGDPGVDLICRHMADLRDAFPKMDISVTHFRDFEKHSGVSILLVQGVMRGPWLNRPASNEYEHLAVVFHLMPNRARNKIKEVHFRSEYLTEETYKKIRALDLLHTAFAVNSSAKAMVRELRDNKANNIEALPVMGVPLLLAASTMPPNKPENAEFNKELEMVEAEMNKNNNLRNANRKNGNVGVVNVNLVTPEVEKNNFLMEVEEGNNNNTDSETEEDEEAENDNKNEEVALGNLPTAHLVHAVDNVGDQQEKENLEAQLIAAIEQEQGINEGANEGANEENDTDEENEDTDEDTDEELEMAEENDEQNQLGGDGYYAAVERIPVGGQPVYQGYSSCCPPYFVTDGSQYDAMCQGGGGREVALGSKTLSMMKDGVVYSMTATVLEEAGNDTASAMGMKGPMKARVKHHLKKHMHDHAHAVVRKNVENGVRHMSKALSKPRGKTMRLVVIPSKGRGKKGAKKGGNLLGTLGTILFPAGSTVQNVVPWLLTIGALMGKRIETDMYSIVDPQKRRVVRKKARRAAPKKKTRRRKPAGKKKVRRKTPAKKKTRKRKSPAKKKSRRRTASKSKKRKTTKRKKVRRRRGPKRGRRWQPLSNADIRRMMTQRGGFCGAGICGDASLSPFDGCRRPEWGPRNWVKPNKPDPICI